MYRSDVDNKIEEKTEALQAEMNKKEKELKSAIRTGDKAKERTMQMYANYTVNKKKE